MRSFDTSHLEVFSARRQPLRVAVDLADTFAQRLSDAPRTRPGTSADTTQAAPGASWTGYPPRFREVFSGRRPAGPAAIRSNEPSRTRPRRHSLRRRLHHGRLRIVHEYGLDHAVGLVLVLWLSLGGTFHAAPVPTEPRFCKPACSPLGFVDTRLYSISPIAAQPWRTACPRPRRHTRPGFRGLGAGLVGQLVGVRQPEIVVRWEPGHVGDRVIRNRTRLGGTGLTAACPRLTVTRWSPASQPTTSTRPRCSCLSQNAGGTGLTLTAANHAVHVDRWWNVAVEDQATDRAFRIGQRRASRCEGSSAPERSRG